MPRDASDGLTLAEMKAAAAEVGIDPVLVERAARLLPPSASASPFERLAGRPARHTSELQLPVSLGEAGAARLLAAVRVSAGQPGTGHSSDIGMVWHGKDDMETFSVTAKPEAGGTAVAVQVDRRATMGVVVGSALMGFLGAGLAGMTLGSQIDPALGAAAAVSGIGGILVAARVYWASSTKRVRERIGGMMDAVGRAAIQSGSSPSAPQETPPPKRIIAQEP